MPIYEYRCPACGTFEIIQKFSDAPLATCPHCLERGKESKVERLVSAAAFHLKGTGWYKTDYASKTNGNGTGHKSHTNGAKDSSSKESSEGTKTESKTDSTSSSDSSE